jgi:hypothetical protein
MPFVGNLYVVNDNKRMDVKTPQVMRCHLCYKTLVLYNPRTKLSKGLISYHKTIGILTLKNHVNVEHNMLAKKLDEEMNSSMQTQVERQPIKSRQNVSSSKILNCFFAKLPYKKDEMQQKKILEDLTLLIVKNHLLVHFLESSWLKKFTLQLYPRIVFPFRKTFSQ